jgi:hypothetical protein
MEDIAGVVAIAKEDDPESSELIGSLMLLRLSGF